MLEIMMGFGVKSEREPLLAGTYEHGYYGEIPATEFITGNDLATNLNLTLGTAFNSDAGWLKFSLDYKTLYVAKRPFRYNMSSGALAATGVTNGSKTIIVKDKLYIVRLLRGLKVPTPSGSVSTGSDTPDTYGSEWNRLMYHISASPNNGAMTSEGITSGDWAQLTNDDLGIMTTPGGARSICMDTIQNGNYVYRGVVSASVANLSNFAAASLATTAAAYGWRPCLELIE